MRSLFLLSRELDTREQNAQHTGTTNVKKEQEVSEMKTHFFFFFFFFFTVVIDPAGSRWDLRPPTPAKKKTKMVVVVLIFPVV